jgi:rod shape-determining protein MreB and related proteins
MTKKRIWAVGGGKGGVGKSLVATNLSVVLANLGGKVVAADLDLGNANMHTYFGIRYPRRTLADFIAGKVQDLNEILLDTSIYNLKFISGSAGIVGSANPGYTQKLKLIRYLERLQVDHVVLDLGAGTSYNIIDFFLGATDHIIVTTPETPSIQSAYNFIRICIFRSLYSMTVKSRRAREILERAKTPASDGRPAGIRELLDELERAEPGSTAEFAAFRRAFTPALIVNMVLKNDETKVGWGIREVVKRHLDVEVDFVGSISFDKVIRESVANEIPYIVNAPNSRPSTEFFSLAAKLLGGRDSESLREIVQREVRRTGKHYSSRVIQASSMTVDPAVYLADRVRDAAPQEKPQEKKESIGSSLFRTGAWSRIAIDLGTSNTRIFVRGRGVILNEPSLMSIEENTGKIVAMGHDSKAMLGRSHSGISIIAPLEGGAITDYTDMKRMVNEFIRIAKRSAILIRPGVVLTIPPKLTNVERRAVREFVKELGAREIHLVYEPLAAAIGAGLPVDIPSASMIVSIGAGSVSAAVISISGIVCISSARAGGYAIDTAIARSLRERHNFSIGNQTAEWIKVTYGQAVKTGRDRRFEIRGQDLSRGIPTLLTVSTAEIRWAIARPVEDMMKVIMSLLEKVPPELSGDLVDRGMILTGGGALLEGLPPLITARTGIGVRIAPNALTAAAEGAGRMLDDFSLYKKFFVEAIEETENAGRGER